MKSDGGGRKSVRFYAEPETAELLLRTIISVNHFSIHGAVADRCEELAQQLSDHSSCSTGNLVAKMKKDSESKVAPTVVKTFQKTFE